MKMGTKKQTRVLYLILVVMMAWSLPPMKVSATHLVGGEITYNWISGNTYWVRVKLYRDCAGITLPSIVNIKYESTSCGMSGTKSISSTSPATPLPLICTPQDTLSTCNGGTLYAIEQIIYVDTLTLPGNCADWTFSYQNCCRNIAITNLATAGAHGMYIEAHLDNLNHPFNNSVEFGSFPVNIIPVDVTTILNWNTFDLDGDSLVYELVPARDEAGGIVTNLAYNTGYTFDQPFMSSLPTSLDAGSGLLSVTPNTSQVSVVAMKISEYRNGSPIGHVYRDLQVIVTSNPNNPPTLSGINGTSNFVISGCPGDTITFDVLANDLDTNQLLSMELSPNGQSASLIASGANPPVGTFSWIVDSTLVSASPYIFTVMVFDDNCPYNGFNTYAYYVFVNACNPNDVWPGDANADGDANLYDLLPIGLAYNETGPVRPNATLNWIAQPCPDWTGSLLSGINYKHADTNGDGTVNISDTTAIAQNFGLNHPLRNPAVPSLAATNLTIIASQDTVPTSTQVDLTIQLDSPGDSIYGLAFRVYFNPSFIMPGSVSLNFANSMFGVAGADMVQLDQVDYLMGYADISITGIDHLNRTSNGPVVVMSIVTTDNVSGKVTFNVAPADVEANDNGGDPVIINASGVALTIDPNLTSLNEYDPASYFNLYSSNQNNINYNYSGKGSVESIEIIDMRGKIIYSEVLIENSGAFEINNGSSGIYNCRAVINGTVINKKLRLF